MKVGIISGNFSLFFSRGYYEKKLEKSVPDPMTADLRESGCERGGRAAILVQYESIFIEIALLSVQSVVAL